MPPSEEQDVEYLPRPLEAGQKLVGDVVESLVDGALTKPLAFVGKHTYTRTRDSAGQHVAVPQPMHFLVDPCPFFVCAQAGDGDDAVCCGEPRTSFATGWSPYSNVILVGVFSSGAG
jgi:hypothetical protein